MKGILRFSALIALLVFGFGTARAQTAITVWTADVSSNFADPDNWDNGAPNIALFTDPDFQLAIIGNSTAANVTTTTTADALVVGTDASNSTLNILSGGNLTANVVVLGFDLGSTGTATISGTGILNSFTVVGSGGEGHLTVSGNGTLNGGVSVGESAGSSGTVTVTGPNAALHDGLFTSDGDATISITNGATLTGSIIMDGAGTSSITIDSGSTFTGGQIVLGSTEGTATAVIDASNATLSSALDIRGNGNLTVQGGATFSTSANSVIGNESGATGTMTVTGSDTTWTQSGQLRLGSNNGSGTGGTGTLTISDGAVVTSGGTAILGYQGADSVGTIIVTGSGSSWDGSGYALNVGSQGTGHLTVQDGATVSSLSADIRAGSGHTSTVLVDGTGATWTVGELKVGSLGPGTSTLTISNGGTVNSGDGHISIGNSIGTVTVTNTDSVWNVSNLTMAQNIVSTATLNITNGGLVANTGDAELGALGTATVNVNGGTWTNTGNINFTGGTGTLTVAGGGAVTSTGINMGVLSGANSTINIGAAANASAAAPGTVFVGAGAIHADSPSTLVFNHTGNAGDNYTFAAPLTGDLSVLHKAGYTTLSGTNTYTGGTIINGGTLVSDGSLTGALGAGDVTVNSGGHLAGFDAIAGDTVVNSGGHLAPNLLRFDSTLTLNGGTNLDFTLGNTLAVIALGDGASLTGPTSGLLTINVFDDGFFAPATYTLIDFSAAGATSDLLLGDFTFGTTISGYDYSLAFNGNTIELTAAISAIPEPSTYAMLAGLGACLAVAWRRRTLGLAFARRRARLEVQAQQQF